MPKLFADISDAANRDFMLLKGSRGCKTNGEAMETIIKESAARERAAIAEEREVNEGVND